MREILFRGRRSWGNKDWVEGDLLHGYSDHVSITKRLIGIETWQVDPESVGQYTGIIDKNNKRVFEHDIVKAYDLIEEISFIGVVKYLDGSFCICDTDFCSYYHWEYYEVEVIGNIHDNPELLKGE